MDKNTPVRKPHTSTADLLTWSENTPDNFPATRSHQEPVNGHGKTMLIPGYMQLSFQMYTLLKIWKMRFRVWFRNHCLKFYRKPCSGYKMKEMTGSGIFKGKGENGDSEVEDVDEASANKTVLRLYQQTLSGISHISFGEEDSVSPKKPASQAEVAKQRELSGNLENDSDSKLNKQISFAKNKELSGNNIFAPPPEIKSRPLGARALALRDSITFGEPTSQGDVVGQSNGASNQEQVLKTAKKIPNQKFTELSGNNIFKGEGPPSADKPLSSAKLREMNGSNIFADGKAESRDFYGGVRKPPGGESSIALV